MQRYLTFPLIKDIEKKPILLSGPRQSGKTVLSKSILGNDYDYLNFDVIKDRKRLLKQDWYHDRKLIIFDEIHKMKKWKVWLKGIFDSNEHNLKFLVTGSAKLNTFRKVGDSLAGRYLYYRLYPFDIKELISLFDEKKNKEYFKIIFPKIDFTNLDLVKQKILDRLLLTSGFPEPFLNAEEGFYNRWQQTHLDVILKQDIAESEQISSVKQIETLTMLLTERVGSTLSYNSLREDLSTDDKTIKRWVDILENSYVLFRIYPYTHRSIAGVIKKAPKVYFFDYVRVEDISARIENLVALALLKEIHYALDAKGQVFSLHFLRNKQKKEIDFLITKAKKPYLLIEVKESESEVSENFSTFEKYFPEIKKIQLVKNLTRGFISKKNVHVVPMHQWLSDFSLNPLTDHN